MDDVPAGAPTPVECGQTFDLAWGGPLSVTGRFPALVTAGEPLVSGAVEVAGPGGVVSGVMTPSADAFLVRDGRVATLPLAQDSVGRRVELGPGSVLELPAQVSLAPCGETRSGGRHDEDSLPPGEYELYARVVLNLDDGSLLEAVGGPWPLEVRDAKERPGTR